MTAKQIQVRVPLERAAWLQAEAERRMVSANYLVNLAIEQLRTTLPPAEELR